MKVDETQFVWLWKYFLKISLFVMKVSGRCVKYSTLHTCVATSKKENYPNWLWKLSKTFEIIQKLYKLSKTLKVIHQSIK